MNVAGMTLGIIAIVFAFIPIIGAFIAIPCIFVGLPVSRSLAPTTAVLPTGPRPAWC